MIDEIDRKIIIALSKDGRRSYTDLARELGIEGITVTKRIEKMLKENIIAIRAEPNPVKMGNTVMACITLDVEVSRMEQVCEELTRVNNISSIITTFGKYDILLFAEYPDVNFLYEAVREKLPDIKGIKAVDAFLISKNKWTEQINNNSAKPSEIDAIDRSLIKELQADGRATFAALAEKYGLSTATVSRRVNTLIKNQVIRITVFANPAKLGQKVVAFIGLQVNLKDIDTVCSRLSAYPQVESVMILTSGYNILTIAVVPDLRSLSDFIFREIASIDGILNVETLIRAELIKRTYIKANIEDMLR